MARRLFEKSPEGPGQPQGEPQAKPPAKRRGSSPERMRELRHLQLARAARDALEAPATSAKMKEQQRDIVALRQEAIDVLGEQLRHRDASIRQRAAKILLDWEQKQEEDQPKLVIYTTAARPCPKCRSNEAEEIAAQFDRDGTIPKK